MGFFDSIFCKKKNSQNDTPKRQDTSVQRQTASSVNPKNIIGQYFTLDQLRQVPMGQVRLQPIDASLAVNTSSQETVATMAKLSPDIKKYLPNLDLSSPEAIGKYFLNFAQKTELGYEFGYSIKMGDDGYMGFIFIHTPALNEKAINFPHWSIDFCLFDFFRGQGIMTQTLARVLFILKTQMNVREVYAYVDEDNEKCLNLLSRLPFDIQPETLSDPATGHKAKLFCCPLHQINFQRR